jgi:putative flippase GtrA
MKKILELIRKRSVFRFAAVGLISTIADIIVLNVLFRGFNLVDYQPVGGYIATTAGFLSGLTVGFFLNTGYVFKVSRTTTNYVQYFVTSGFGLLITLGIIHYLYDLQGWRINFAKLVAVGVVFVWNYSWSRFWIFKPETRNTK